MKVFASPFGLHSRAMNRIARAIRRHAPVSVEFTLTPYSADVVVLYVIGLEAMQIAKDLRARGTQYVAMQCCLGGAHDFASGTNQHVDTDWDDFWRGAALVWSYYDMREHAEHASFRFYHSPLGIDPVFTQDWLLMENGRRRFTLMTSGYVSGHGAEPIGDCWWAINKVGGTGIHIGKDHPAGMSELPPGWRSREGISDEEMAVVYHESQYVAALRHVEGFEMPAIEGLACGARPIVFDRPDMRQWYDGHAVFIPEDLYTAQHVAAVLAAERDPVTAEERSWALRTFNWETICSGFWDQLDVALAAQVAEVPL